jgi:RNA-directed DNA polymerase
MDKNRIEGARAGRAGDLTAKSVSIKGATRRFGDGARKAAALTPGDLRRVAVATEAVDRELERRGLRFVRYADDCNIYVRSARAGHRVMDRVTRFITAQLKLTVNASKSAVARPQERTFLGFTFTAGPTVARAIAPKAVRRFKTKVREITRRAKGVSLETTIAELAPYLRGWRNYFGFCETPEALVYLTRWIPLRLRAALWRQWRTPRRRRAALLAPGVRPRLADHTAGSGLGPWYLAPAKALGLPRLIDGA